MRRTVLDASAVLAFFFDQAGAEKLETLLHKATETDTPLLITAPNWAEVLHQMQAKRGTEGLKAALRFEHTLPLHIIPLDRDLAESAAALKSKYGLAFACCYAAALAIANKAELLVADSQFRLLQTDMKLSWLE